MTADASFRCSAAGLERADSIAGSASTVRSFLLIENPGRKFTLDQLLEFFIHER